LLSDTRHLVIEERLGLGVDDARAKAKLVTSFKSLGFDKTMLRILRRDKTSGEISLLLAYASQCLSDRIEAMRGLSSWPSKEPGFADGFNLAMSYTDGDLANIDRTITALTGRANPREGRSR
jgi:hypothetical protein